jgi:hypothetical protein
MPGLHFCIANGRTALLDVTHDRYLALPEPLDLAFQALVMGTDAAPIEASSIDNLIEQGVLLRSEGATSLTAPAPLERPTASLLDTPLDELIDPWLFTHAYISQRHAVKRSDALCLPAIVKAIIDDLNGVGTARELRANRRALRALRSYLATRWLISTRDQCLVQSATLFHFLARYGWRPQFVIAVRMAPFAAHAWLQDGKSVLNDRLDHVLPYTPILVL